MKSENPYQYCLRPIGPDAVLCSEFRKALSTLALAYWSYQSYVFWKPLLFLHMGMGCFFIFSIFYIGLLGLLGPSQ